MGAGVQSAAGGARSRGKPAGTPPSGAPCLPGKTPATTVTASGPRQRYFSSATFQGLCELEAVEGGGGMEGPGMPGR